MEVGRRGSLYFFYIKNSKLSGTLQTAALLSWPLDFYGLIYQRPTSHLAAPARILRGVEIGDWVSPPARVPGR